MPPRDSTAKWGKADLNQVAVTNRDFMSTHSKAKFGFPPPPVIDLSNT